MASFGKRLQDARAGIALDVFLWAIAIWLPLNLIIRYIAFGVSVIALFFLIKWTVFPAKKEPISDESPIDSEVGVSVYLPTEAAKRDIAFAIHALGLDYWRKRPTPKP